MISERSLVILFFMSSLVATLQAKSTDNLCENKFSGIIPYPGRCDKYVLCVLWSPIEILCPEDEFFDKQVLQCVKGDRLLCERITTENPITSTTAVPTLNEICFGVFFSPRPYPSDDQLFVGCIRGRGTIFQCEENEIFTGDECVEIYTSTVFTSTPSTTTTMRMTTTTEVPILKNICVGIYNAFIKHPSKDCSLYIQCYQQSETVYQCKIGEIFSLDQQRCVPGDDETCELFPENTVIATVPTQMTTSETSIFSESSTSTTYVVITQETPTSIEATTTEAPIPTSESNTTKEPTLPIDITEATISTREPNTTQELTISAEVTTTEEAPATPELQTTTKTVASITTLEQITSTIGTTIEEVFQNPCYGIVYDEFPHPTKCFMFIKCIMSRFQIVTCSQFEIYDVVSKQCVIGDQETCKAIFQNGINI